MKQSLRYATLVGMLLVAGCGSSVAPTENNLGIPAGAKQGEYGFYINGGQFDSGNPFGGGGASIRPYLVEGPGAVMLSISMYYNFPDGTSGIVDLSIPLLVPKPKNFQFSDVSSPWTLDATGSVYCDSDGSIFYQSIPGGTLAITKLDTVQNLVSGYFELTAYETSPTTDLHKTIGISYGYFNDIPIGEGAYGQGSVTASVNGNSFSTNMAGFEILYATPDFSAPGEGPVNLWAYAQGQFLNHEISIQGIPLAVASYVLSDSNKTPFVVYWDRTKSGNQGEASTQHTGSTGQLSITSCDIASRRISGTFQFSGTDTLGNSVTITSGEINNIQWEP